MLISERTGIDEEFGSHGCVCKNEVRSVGIEKGNFARLFDTGGSIYSIDAVTDIQHKYVSEDLMEIINKAEGIVVIIEVIPVVKDVVHAELVGESLVVKHRLLDLSQAGVKLVISQRSEEEIVI